MIALLGRLSWLLFNVGVPVLAPVALLPLMGFSRLYRPISKGIATQAIREGQLLWVVISMCASACYEIGHALGDMPSGETFTLLLAGLAWHGMFIVIASVLVSLGAADSAHGAPQGENGEATDQRLMWWSLVMTALVAASFSISHYSLN